MAQYHRHGSPQQYHIQPDAPVVDVPAVHLDSFGIVYIASAAGICSGIKFESFEAPVANWVRNVIGQQGGIMLEPYYNNVLDFGMEFQCQKQSVRYCGLSVFSTDNGFYNGNVVAPESYKLEIISSMIAPERLLMVREAMEKILSSEMENGYSGPLGVDMMIARMEDGSFRLHPMVEINVRRTMGHVALAISPLDDDLRRVMHIETGNIYKLKIRMR